MWDWLPNDKTWLDFADVIVTGLVGLGTLGIAYVNLKLLKRDREELPRLAITLAQLEVTTSVDGVAEKWALFFSVTNVGILPISINSAYVIVTRRDASQDHIWLEGIQLQGRKLALGETASHLLDIGKDGRQSLLWNLPLSDSDAHRPLFFVVTTLGKRVEMRISKETWIYIRERIGGMKWPYKDA